MSCDVVWFRNDLRLHDHLPLLGACESARSSGGSIIPVFVIDPWWFGKTSFGFERIGRHRLKFLRESLLDLSQKLEKRGSRLEILVGNTAEVLVSLCCKYNVQRVHFHQHFATEEAEIERTVIGSLAAHGIPCHAATHQTLYAKAALPFSVDQLPELFTNFRQQVEKHSPIESPREAPDRIPGPPAKIDGSRCVEDVPQLTVHDRVECDPDFEKGTISFGGGETEALQRLEDYFWNRDCLRDYKLTRNGMLGVDYSSKLSPWLALGCVSARRIYQEIKRYECERIQNESTYWLVFELIWRDFFAFVTAKHGAKIFQVGGVNEKTQSWNTDRALFGHWCSGTTGYPLIDANMRELAATGFMSNRGRQNVASFLTKNLGIDWRMGAEWFESMLIDYDACSNFGNWNYIAGVGNDARKFRWFNTIKQAQNYDPEGSYVKHWLPALQEIPHTLVHTPWEMTSSEQKKYRCNVPTDYPLPVVDLFESAKRQERIAGH